MTGNVKVKSEAPQRPSDTIISDDQQRQFRNEIYRLGHLLFLHHHGKR